MAKNGIRNYGELQTYWRRQIKQAFNPNRKVIYWVNEATDLITEAD